MQKISEQWDQQNVQILSKIINAHSILLIVGLMIGCAAFLTTEMTAQESTSTATPNDPRQDMIRSLGASGPRSSLGDQARVFDRLVGTWDCDYSFHLDDGSVRHKKGELLVGWILDGRAVQDIFLTYSAEGEKDRRIGTTIRFFDTAINK